MIQILYSYKRSNNYPPEFRRAVLAYAKANTPSQAVKKFKVSMTSIRRWKEKQCGQSDVKSRKASGSESFEDLYSDEDSLGAKKRKRRKPRRWRWRMVRRRRRQGSNQRRRWKKRGGGSRRCSWRRFWRTWS